MPSIDSMMTHTFRESEIDEIRDLVRKAYEEGFDDGVEAREEVRKKDFHATRKWDWESRWWSAIRRRRDSGWMSSIVQNLMCKLLGFK